MRARLAGSLLLLIALVLSGPVAQAQMTTEDVIDPGPRNETVQDTLAWERLQTKVRYLRPDAEFRPGEDIQVKIPPKPRTAGEERDSERTDAGIIAALFIVVVVVVLILFGNRINVSFGKTSEKKRQTRNEQREGGGLIAAADLPKSGILDHLAAMGNRRRALILLTGLALERAAKMNGLTLARAQTARDVLRILPRSWHHMPAMRQLVREAEIVHFGGRDLGEDTWKACLAAARPLFAGEESTA